MTPKLEFEIHQAISAITAAWAKKSEARDVRQIVQFSRELLAVVTWQGERSAALCSAHAATVIYMIEATDGGGDIIAVAHFWSLLWEGVADLWPPPPRRRGR